MNKNDLEPGASLAGIYERAGFRVIVTSAETGEGMDELHAAISRQALAFTGNSGVGKSSILNKLCPELHLAVGEVSEKLGRGRHTTRHIELYALGDDTFVADTPGFSSFDTERMDLVLKEQLPEAFSDFAPYLGKCQFPDCAHLKEPGCAVRAALEQGKIEPTRYDSYRRLYELAKDTSLGAERKGELTWFYRQLSGRFWRGLPGCCWTLISACSRQAFSACASCFRFLRWDCVSCARSGKTDKSESAKPPAGIACRAVFCLRAVTSENFLRRLTKR